MGYAAYWRGSKAISDGIARDAYRDGCSWYNPDAPAPKPKPRQRIGATRPPPVPPTW